MSDNSTPQQNWFEPLSPRMADKERVAAIKAAWERVLNAADQSGDIVTLSKDDLYLLRRYAKDKNRAVASAALEVLIEEIRSRCEDGPISWEELEAWGLDPEDDVRHEVMYAIGSRDAEAYELCWTDRPRCARLIGEAVDHYMDHPADAALWSLSRYNDEWFDACWAEATRLVDEADPEIIEMLSNGFVEDVIKIKGAGPDDPRIKSWIESDKQGRKLALLGVTQWLPLNEGRLREIVEALANDNDEKIASTAKQLIKAADTKAN